MLMVNLCPRFKNNNNVFLNSEISKKGVTVLNLKVTILTLDATILNAEVSLADLEV